MKDIIQNRLMALAGENPILKLAVDNLLGSFNGDFSDVEEKLLKLSNSSDAMKSALAEIMPTPIEVLKHKLLALVNGNLPLTIAINAVFEEVIPDIETYITDKAKSSAPLSVVSDSEIRIVYDDAELVRSQE